MSIVSVFLKYLKSLFLLLFIILILFSGCSRGISDEEKVKILIEKNLRALEDEDLEGYMSTLSSDSPGFGWTKTSLRYSFDKYDLDYEIEEITITDMSETKAHVKVIKTIKPVNNSDFKPNRTEAIHTLIKKNGEWKIAKSEMLGFEYL